MNRHESIMGAVAICAIVFAPATAAADCALMGLAPKVLSQPDTVLAPEGGFVVGAVSIDRGSLEDGDIATQVEFILAEQFKERGYSRRFVAVYSHSLVGMVALVGQWWLNDGSLPRDAVAAHIVNLAWNGLSELEKQPKIARVARK